MWTLFAHEDDPEAKTSYVDFPADLSCGVKTQRSKINITYLVYQEERCPTTKRLHLQGYVEFDKSIKLHPTLKNAFNKRISWRKRAERATAEDNRRYCTKPESATGRHRYEEGKISEESQGKRNDLKRVADAISQGVSMVQVARENPETYIKYHRGMEALAMRLSKPPEDREIDLRIFIGPPGTGKSSYCRELVASMGYSHEDVCYPSKNNTGKWSFEDYNDEPVLMLEDFERGCLTADQLKVMTDRYAHKLGGRGQSRWGRQKVVLISSNATSLSEWFEANGNNQANREAIERRANEIFECHMDKWTLIGGKKLKDAIRTQIDNPMRHLIDPKPAANTNFIEPAAPSQEPLYNPNGDDEYNAYCEAMAAMEAAMAGHSESAPTQQIDYYGQPDYDASESEIQLSPLSETEKSNF